MVSFIEQQLPSSVALNAQGGAAYSTDIIETHSGYEQRNINWSQAKGRWTIDYLHKNSSDMGALLDFFNAVKGKAIGFRFKDWSDYKATNENIGTGDGSDTTFQLRKSYTKGASTVYRDITRPVASSETIKVNGVVQSSPADYTLDTETGIVTFTSAPTGGHAITASFEFDVPVRFGTDQINVVSETPSIFSWSGIPIVEIRG